MRHNSREQMLVWSSQTQTHTQMKEKTQMRILCVEPAKCSPIISWWCSGFCSLWLIISSFQSVGKQPINFIQVLIQLLRCYTWKVTGARARRRSKVKNKKGSFKTCERARRQFSNPLIIAPRCFSHFPLNLCVTSITDSLEKQPGQRGGAPSRNTST